MHKSTQHRRTVPIEAVHAPEAELQLLANLLLATDVSDILEHLPDEAFYNPKYRKIYKAIRKCAKADSRYSIVTVTDELRSNGELESIGGEEALLELTSKVDFSALSYAVRVVADRYLMRRLQDLAVLVLQKSSDTAATLLPEVERELYQIMRSRYKNGKDFRSIAYFLPDVIELLEQNHRRAAGTKITGIPSGYSNLDRLTGGWQNTDLIIIAGRPSSGKTAFALSVIRNAVRGQDGVAVGLFSLEMSAYQVITRLLAGEARVDAHAMRTGQLSDGDWKQLTLSSQILASAPIYIDETAAISLSELKTKARRLCTEHGARMIVVDYINLMTAPQAETREQEISQISKGLKELAKELNIPILALAQLNRAIETRRDKRPMLSDLRESGSLEQDADVIVFVHRPEMYIEPNTAKYHEWEGKAEIIIGKQRNGPVDTVKLAFVHHLARFENLAQEPTYIDNRYEREDAF